MDVTELLIKYGLSGLGVVLLTMWITGKLRPEREVREMREDRDFWRQRALYHLDLADRATTVSSAALSPVVQLPPHEVSVLERIQEDLAELKRVGRQSGGGRQRKPGSTHGKSST